MAPWLDTAVVAIALLGSGAYLVRLYRKKPATAGCAKGCGSCAPTKPANELVKLGGTRKR